MTTDAELRAKLRNAQTGGKGIDLANKLRDLKEKIRLARAAKDEDEEVSEEDRDKLRKKRLKDERA